MFTRLRAYFHSLLTRRRAVSEADDELQFHVEHETAANIARGLSAAEARRVALRDLGGLTQTREAVRDVRAAWMDLLWRDVRYAVRALRAAPGFSIVALSVLTLSIGATTAIYSVVDAVILRGLPFRDASRLVAISERNIRSNAIGAFENLVAPQQFLDWREQQTVFTKIAAIGYASVSLRPEGGREPETLEAQAVTADFFSVLGTPPMLGRAFTIDNEVAGKANVVVISHALWQRRFGGAPDVVGRRLPGQRADFEIVGVMPAAFAYPVGALHPTEVWLPNVFQPDDRIRADSFSYRLQVVGRLRDGVTIDGAQAQMDQITARLAAATPRWFRDRAARVESLHAYLTGGVRTWMLMLFAAVAIVLLIACVNLSNLTLARASVRTRELLIRAALGASRWDLARALLTESLVLSAIGGVLGALAAWGGIEVFRAALPAEIPRAASIAVDARVLAAVAIMAVLTGVVFSIAPIVRFSRPATAAALTTTGRANTAGARQQWLGGALVVAEVALAAVLLVGSGLFLGSYAKVRNIDLGLATRDVLAVRIQPLVGADNWARAQQQNRGLLFEVLNRVRVIPGVDVAALVGGGLPLRGDLQTRDFAVPGAVLSGNEHDIDRNQVSSDYFRVLNVPLLKGRFFTDADRDGSEPVAIINDLVARRYFPGQDPIGRTVTFEGTRTIVGVVGNIRHDGPETDWRREGFVPFDQSQEVGATLVLKLSRDVADVLPAVKAAIWSQFPTVPLPEIRTLDHYLARMVAQRQFNMLLLALFGLLGIVIAIVGLYGVMAYVVSQRTQEIGIRMALGALPIVILRSVLGRALTYLAIGVATGLTGALGASGLIASFLFEIQPHDVVVYLLVAVVFIVTGLVAAFIPALRASRIDPLVALRSE